MSPTVIVYNINGNNDLLKKFRVIPLIKTTSFPLSVYKEEKELKKDPIKENLDQLACLVVGTDASKQKIIDEFKAKYPDANKKAIDEKLTNGFVKEVRGEINKAIWFAKDDLVEEIQTD